MQIHGNHCSCHVRKRLGNVYCQRYVTPLHYLAKKLKWKTLESVMV